jgi:hypothetical protein
VTLVILGGTGIYTYFWGWQSGGAGIATTVLAGGASATFTAAGMTWGETRSGVVVVSVQDTVSGLFADATVNISITCQRPSELLIEGSGLSLLLEDGITPLVVEP